MIYNEEYKIKYYKDSRTGREPVRDYINNLDLKHRLKIFKYIEFLRNNNGYLDEPYSRHINGKIRELKVDFANNYYRILYFAFVNKNIIILHAFSKKTDKTPLREIEFAINIYNKLISNYQLYEID
jgi:phage-related protein